MLDTASRFHTFYTGLPPDASVADVLAAVGARVAAARRRFRLEIRALAEEMCPQTRAAAKPRTRPSHSAAALCGASAEGAR